MVRRFEILFVFLLLMGCTPPSPSIERTSAAQTASVTQAPMPAAAFDKDLSAMKIDPIGMVTNVHDPTMIQEGNIYYLFSTGAGISIRCSKDMKLWDSCGRVFGANPNWLKDAVPGVKDLWAPDIIYHNGVYYLYYTASTFGSNRSVIGLVTNTTLDSKNPEYAWMDQGEVISSQKTDRYNAIDPNLTFDQSGQPWLVFGSFWSGIKMVKVDPATMKPLKGESMMDLAAKPGTDAVEGAFITFRENDYYLFVSHDYCCKGTMSSYNIRVGRSSEITGPYVDQDGKYLTEGGGTLVYKGSNRWRGPGHNSIYIEDDLYYMVYHAYDANFDGVPTLRIELLGWDQDGWPFSPSAKLGQ